MKRSTLIIATLLLTVWTSILSAQQSTYVKEPGYWILGVNAGLAYQQSDVPAILDGYGVGLTLAKNLYYQPRAPFSLDLRGRFLYTRSYGLDHARSSGIRNNDALNGTFGLDYRTEAGGPGYVFQNHKTDHAELGLEAVLNFNQLKEKSNVLFSLYGGLGIDWFDTEIDQRDNNGLYSDAYRNIDPLRSVSSIKKNLKENILDGNYETKAHGFDNDMGKLRIMPSLGAELGYQLTPRFSAGIGHRITFSGTDLLDGHQWDNNNNLTGENDWLHYTSLHLRWEIPAKEKVLPAPLITITSPGTNPYVSRIPDTRVTARIRHVNSAMDVTAELNGFPVNFDFRKEQFATRLDLDPGRNELVITATNTVGTDRKTQIIIYEERIINNPPPVQRPEIDFINPPQDNYQVVNPAFVVRASISNIENKGDIRFLLNGRATGFNYDYSRQLLSSDIRLREGRNELRIEAENRGGSDLAFTTVILVVDRPEPPSVQITRPAADPYLTENDRISIEARTERVAGIGDIEYKVNDRTIRDFNFINNTFRAEAYLKEGINIVSVQVYNSDGQDKDEIRIEYRPRRIQLPEVRITTPNRQYSSTTVSPQNIRAEVRNIDRQDQISMFVNGRRSGNFSFNSRSRTISATVSLPEGQNEIAFEVINESGRDQAAVFITYQREIIVQPSRPPQVTISRPADQTTVETEEVDVRARLLHVLDRRNVNLSVNGRSTNDFSFNPGSNELTARVRLIAGSNRINVSGSNIDGSDQDEVTINYRRTLKPPVVEITRPSGSNTETSEATADIRATIQNILEKRDISMSVNGRSTNDFSFNVKGRSLQATVQLREGDNRIVIRATNRDGSDQDEVTINYRRTLKPPVVEITRPSGSNTETSEATADIRATIQNILEKRDISMSVNGRSTNDFSFNVKGRSLQATVQLREGDNRIVIRATNRDGSDQDEVTINYRRALKPPVVEITRPSGSNTETSEATADIRATIQNVLEKKDISMSVNGRSTNDFSFNARGRSLQATVQLREGDNRIVIRATNRDGSDQDEVTINYRRALKPPVVEITRPSGSNTETSEATADIRATIQNVLEKKDISMSVNGRSTNDFSFNARGRSLQASVQLREGDNRIVIRATNRDGSDQDEATINYKVRIPLPDVVITSPANNSTHERSKVSIKARIANVQKKEQVTFNVNGRTIKDFTYTNSVFIGQAILKEGKNLITIEGRNEAGSDKEQLKLVYRPAVAKPTARFVRPAKPGEKVKTARFNLEVKLEHIDDKKDISLKINGKETKTFKYNAKSGTLTMLTGLKKGRNTFAVKASNSSGTAQAESWVLYESEAPVLLLKPRISEFSNSAPVLNPFDPNHANITIEATLVNVRNRDEIRFSLNGVLNTEFDFNERTGVFSGRLKLTRSGGKQKIILKVSNAQGSDEKEKILDF